MKFTVVYCNKICHEFDEKMVLKLFYFPWMIIPVVEFGLWRSPISFFWHLWHMEGLQILWLSDDIWAAWVIIKENLQMRSLAGMKISCALSFYFIFTIHYEHLTTTMGNKISSSHSEFQIEYNNFSGSLQSFL